MRRKERGHPYRSDSYTLTVNASKLAVTFANSTLIACVKATTRRRKKINETITNQKKNHSNTKKMTEKKTDNKISEQKTNESEQQKAKFWLGKKIEL